MRYAIRGELERSFAAADANAATIARSSQPERVTQHPDEHFRSLKFWNVPRTVVHLEFDHGLS